MKLAKVLESGITGATTFTMLRETLDNITPNGQRFLHKKGMLRQLKKATNKKGGDAAKIYIKLAAELLGLIGSMGISSLGKKKNIVLRGAVLGGLAGSVSLLVNSDKEDVPEVDQNELWRKRIITIALYIRLADWWREVQLKHLRKTKRKKINNGVT
ncbi:MAG: hypothetical protein JWP81_998 [Ferruginibacter sp.]|nr:hypothetical protein [Ferruginibacter sp.]